MLDVEVLAVDPWEQHVLKPRDVFREGGGIVVAPGDLYLSHVQSRAKVSSLPSPPTEVTRDDQPIPRLHEIIDRVDEAFFHGVNVPEQLPTEGHVLEDVLMVEVQV
jgi:hypothetical protein